MKLEVFKEQKMKGLKRKRGLSIHQAQNMNKVQKHQHEKTVNTSLQEEENVQYKSRMEDPTMHKYPERGLLAIEYLPVIPTPPSKTGTYGNRLPWGCQLAIECKVLHTSTATDLIESPMTITACGHGGDVQAEDKMVVLKKKWLRKKD